MYYLYVIGKFLANIFPRRWGYFLASIISDIRLLFSREDKKNVYENLRVIFPHMSPRQLNVYTKQVFRNFAKYLVDFLRSPKIDREFIERNVDFAGWHILEEFYRSKKRFIIFTCHLGNWELGGQVACNLGYRIWGVALPHKDMKVNVFFNHMRSLQGLKTVPVGKGTRQIVRLIKEGDPVAFLGDRDYSGTGTEIDFFGRKTYIPSGVGFFSLKFSCPIIPIFFVREFKDRFRMICEEPIFPEGKSLEEVLRECVKVMEKYIRKYPQQWYMFDKFWIE